MPFISITRIRLRSWRFLPGFAWYSFQSAREARKTEGNLGTRLLADRRNTFWTATSWTSDLAMKKFMLAGSHRQAMNKLPHWCDEAAFAHWPQDNDELPTWPVAHQGLEREGRPAKVQRPSPAHTQHKFPEPRFGARFEIRFK